jgi:hypothetical protein
MTKDQLRAAEPKIAAWADDIRKELEGAKVSHLRIGEYEYGEACEKGVPVTLDHYKVSA